MYYYRHHIGDFNHATRHLTRTERSIYRDLIDIYYDTEKPLPSDLERLARVALVAKKEMLALENVLKEFFELTDEGYVNRRCESEIDGYYEQLPKEEEKKKNQRERQQRAREKRRQLFEQARELAIETKWNMTTEELQKIVVSHSNTTTKSQTSHKPVTRDELVTSHTCHAPVTAIHEPRTNNQNQEPELYTPLPPKKISTETESQAQPRDFFTEFHEVWHEVLPGMESGSIFAVESAVANLLVRNSGVAVKQAIRNYAEVLNSDAHFYTHKHTLADFLKSHVFKFFDSMTPLTNFLKDGAKKPEPVNSSLSDEDFARIANGGAL